MATDLSSRPRFYYVDEASEQLRRSPASIRWMMQTGQIRAGKIGGRVVIAAEEIDRLIAEAFAEAG